MNKISINNDKQDWIISNLMILTVSNPAICCQPPKRTISVRTFLNQLVVVTKHKLDIELPGLASFFQPSLYSRGSQGNLSIYYDKSVRNCSTAQFNGDQFATINQSLASALSLNEEIISQVGTWSVLKYANGHFIQHIDYSRPLEGYVHISNLILIPPRSKCSYEGGCLKTWDGVNRVQIYPDQDLWTRVVIPHGVPHQVEKVTGTRITYMKPIYVVKKEGHLYENPCQDYEGPRQS